MPNWYASKILDKKEWTPGLFTLTVDAAGVQPFLPGQFLHLAVERDGQLINRAYSVASPYGPSIEFFIVEVEDGALTPNLNRLQVGDPILVSDRAAGSFTLEKAPDAQCIWLIGTGTGLAPYIAMLRDPFIWERYPKIVVAHGTRFIRDLGYFDELREMQQQRGGRFYYLPTVTREQGEGVQHGRLTTLLEDGSLERAAGIEICESESAVMLCGNPDMLDEMEKILMDRCLKRHRTKAPGQIVVERYW